MRQLYRTSLLYSAFIIMIAALIIVNYRIYYDEVAVSPLSDKEDSASSQSTPPSQTPPAIRDTFEFAQTLARPLFSPTRRDFSPDLKSADTSAPTIPAAIEAKQQPKKPDIQFQGTLVIGSSPRALITLKGASEAQWLKVDDKIDEWRVSKITQDRLVLVSQNEEATYDLYQIKD